MDSPIGGRFILAGESSIPALFSFFLTLLNHPTQKSLGGRGSLLSLITGVSFFSCKRKQMKGTAKAIKNTPKVPSCHSPAVPRRDNGGVPRFRNFPWTFPPPSFFPGPSFRRAFRPQDAAPCDPCPSRDAREFTRLFLCYSILAKVP